MRMERPDHILIVDDDAEIRRLLEAYLSKNGLRVSTAAEGHAMWQALEAGQGFLARHLDHLAGRGAGLLHQQGQPGDGRAQRCAPALRGDAVRQ